MEIAGEGLSSANLDHHGLVAAVCQDLGIASKINEVLELNSTRCLEILNIFWN